MTLSLSLCIYPVSNLCFTSFPFFPDSVIVLSTESFTSAPYDSAWPNRSRVPRIPDRTGSFRCPFQRLNERKRRRVGWGEGESCRSGRIFTGRTQNIKIQPEMWVFFFFVFFPPLLPSPCELGQASRRLLPQIGTSAAKEAALSFSNSFRLETQKFFPSGIVYTGLTLPFDGRLV